FLRAMRCREEPRKRRSVRGCGAQSVGNIAPRSRGRQSIEFPRMSVSEVGDSVKQQGWGGSSSQEERTGTARLQSCQKPAHLVLPSWRVGTDFGLERNHLRG